MATRPAAAYTRRGRRRTQTTAESTAAARTSGRPGPSSHPASPSSSDLASTHPGPRAPGAPPALGAAASESQSQARVGTHAANSAPGQGPDEVDHPRARGRAVARLPAVRAGGDRGHGHRGGQQQGHGHPDPVADRAAS